MKVLSQSQDLRAVARASQAEIRATNLINTRKRKELCLVWTGEEASDGLAALAVSVTANAAATPLVVVVVARVGCMPLKTVMRAGRSVAAAGGGHGGGGGTTGPLPMRSTSRCGGACLEELATECNAGTGGFGGALGLTSNSESGKFLHGQPSSCDRMMRQVTTARAPQIDKRLAAANSSLMSRPG